MKREIIAYKGYFKEFFDRLDTGTQDKILYVLMLLQTQDRIPLKFMKLIEEGLYELRIEYQSNIYRIFFCFDEGRIVILFNGFQKKTEKTPKKEIEKDSGTHHEPDHHGRVAVRMRQHPGKRFLGHRRLRRGSHRRRGQRVQLGRVHRRVRTHRL